MADPTVFPSLRNNVRTTLRVRHNPGDPTIVVAQGQGTRFGSPTPDDPVTVSVDGPSGARVIYKCTGRTADTLTVAVYVSGPDAGPDAMLPPQSTVAMRWTAGQADRVSAAINAVEAGKAGVDDPNLFTAPQTLPLIDKGGQAHNCFAYGAAGDGTTDDTAAIRATVAAAGAGGTVLLPRATYLVSGTITLLDHQVLMGNQAILKRAPQKVAVTTAAVGIGDVTIVLQALNGIRVGDEVSLAFGIPLPTTGQRVAAPGTGYANGETVTFTGGLVPGGTAATGHITASGGAITGLVIDTQGAGYVSSPKVVINTTSGAGGVVVPPFPTPIYEADDNAHPVTAISGTTLTVTRGSAVAFDAGAACYTSWHGIHSSGNGIRIYDLIFDGSREDWTFYPWNVAVEIESSGNGNIISGCEIYESPGEGIVAFGSYNSYDDCYIHDINGNGIHFSGSAHATVTNCRVINGNQDQAVGHGYRAGIAWSAEISDPTMVGNFVQNCLNGFGAIKDTLNSDVTILGNTVRDCWESGIGMVATTIDRAPSGVLIKGNRIYNCPIGLNIGDTNPGTSVWPSNIIVDGNYFRDCAAASMTIGLARYVTVTNNEFRGAIGAVNTPHVYVSSSKNLLIADNIFEGGSHAVFLESSGSFGENVKITDNLILYPHAAGIRFDNAGFAGSSADGNTIIQDATAANSFIGIMVRSPASATRNKLHLDATPGSVIGIYCVANMSTDAAGCDLRGNEIRGTAQYGILAGQGQCVLDGEITTDSTPIRNDAGKVTTPAIVSFTVVGGVITAASVVQDDDGITGGNYGQTPAIYALDAAGTGATFTAVMTGPAITSVTVNSGGTGYVAPVASITGNYVGTNWKVK